MKEEKENEEKNRFLEEVLKQVSEKMEVDVPEEIIDDAIIPTLENRINPITELIVHLCKKPIDFRFFSVDHTLILLRIWIHRIQNQLIPYHHCRYPESYPQYSRQ